MNTTVSPETKQLMDDIKANQQVLMTTTKKHLELYAQQIAKSDELSNQLFQIQKMIIQTQQRMVIIATFAVVASLLIYTFVN